MGTSFKCKDLLEKLQKTFDLLGDTIVYFGDDGSLTTGGRSLNKRDADMRSQSDKEEKLNSGDKEASPIGETNRAKPTICPTCNGEGWIYWDYPYGGDDMCRSCNGTGKQ